MDSNLKERFQNLYAQMFTAIQMGNKADADLFRTKMEQIRQSCISKRRDVSVDLDSLPEFVKSTLNKSQDDLGISEGSNCINAAFNFHFQSPIFSPFSTADFLSMVQSDFYQLPPTEKLELGDLVVFWSRNGDQWKDRYIVLTDLKTDDPEFPFGLVFDHIAVYVGENKLFHKPDPTLTSRYQVNEWDDVVGFNEGLPGFELTFHRKING